MSDPGNTSTIFTTIYMCTIYVLLRDKTCIDYRVFPTEEFRESPVSIAVTYVVYQHRSMRYQHLIRISGLPIQGLLKRVTLLKLFSENRTLNAFCTAISTEGSAYALRRIRVLPLLPSPLDGKLESNFFEVAIKKRYII